MSNLKKTPYLLLYVLFPAAVARTEFVVIFVEERNAAFMIPLKVSHAVVCLYIVFSTLVLKEPSYIITKIPFAKLLYPGEI